MLSLRMRAWKKWKRTANGRLIVKKDEAGTPTDYRKVAYEFIVDDRKVPVLKAVESP